MDTGADNVFEFDGTEDSTGTIDGAFTVQNVTAYGNPAAEKTDTYDIGKVMPPALQLI